MANSDAGKIVKLRNGTVAGVISIAAVVGLAGPGYAAPQPAALKADKCSLHVSIPHPHAGQTEILTVATTAGKTTVRVIIRYRTVSHTWKITTPSTPRTTYRFGVGDPTKNYKVTLAETVIGAPKGYGTGATCSTSFVPD